MNTRNRLELTWVGKDQRPRLEPRILLEEPEFSYHAAARRNTADQFDNLLIHGDNLLALKALEAEYAGKVKCIFIDPPYNTGSAFTHYDDGLEHSLWLSMMRDRLEILRGLLREDGSIWITIDDNEAHYLKVLCDEVFGRANFVGNIVWQSKDTPGNNASTIAQTHNMVLVFKKSQLWRPNLIPRNEKQIANYRNPDDDSRGPWLGTPLTRAEFRERDYYPLINAAGQSVWPPKGSSWRRPPDEIKRLEREGRVYWGKDGSAEFPVEKKFLSEVKGGVVPQTWWPYEFAGSTRNASAELKGLFGGEKAFDTPKPEKIIQRVLEVATAGGDLILDSFAGSGTTGAVAHKMGRRWIMVELGEHAKTHIVPRLRKVIDGADPGGVTQACGWQGGGGYRFLRLAPSLMQKNAFGHWVISREYNAEMLAEAVCKHLGFRYAPRPDFWWMMGQSSERDFICVTTASLTHEELRAISDEVGTERTLLICCKAFMARTEAFDNLTVQKIPQTILHRCEWGRDDYSLRVAALPEAEPAPAPAMAAAPEPARAKPSRKTSSIDPTPDLFGSAPGEET